MKKPLQGVISHERIPREPQAPSRRPADGRYGHRSRRNHRDCQAPQCQYRTPQLQGLEEGSRPSYHEDEDQVVHIHNSNPEHGLEFSFAVKTRPKMKENPMVSKT